MSRRQKINKKIVRTRTTVRTSTAYDLNHIAVVHVRRVKEPIAHGSNSHSTIHPDIGHTRLQLLLWKKQLQRVCPGPPQAVCPRHPPHNFTLR